MSDLASLLEKVRSAKGATDSLVTDGVTAPVVAVYAPCPFCDGDMEPRSDYGRIRYEHTASRPDCADCAGFALYFYADDPAQVAAWNRRSHPIKAGEAVPVTEAMCSADAGTATMWWCADASRAWARSSLFVLTGRRSSSTS